MLAALPRRAEIFRDVRGVSPDPQQPDRVHNGNFNHEFVCGFLVSTTALANYFLIEFFYR
jgi:hypothetical protein